MGDLATQVETSHSGAAFDVLRARGFEPCRLPREIDPLRLDRVMAGPAFTVWDSDKATESLVGRAIVAGGDPKQAYLSHGRF